MVVVLAACAGHTGTGKGVGTASASSPSAARTAAASPSHSAGKPSRLRTIATVGPLFPAGLSSAHTCTAAVVASAAGNVILTAAHCVAGTGAGLLFVPGYDNGKAPYGSWTVAKAYAARGWTRGQSPKLDYAFLLVTASRTNRTAASVQSVVGANALGASAPAVGEPVTVAGYRLGRDDEPLICHARVHQSEGYPSFDCPGYIIGTSGSPWIVDFDVDRGAGTITAVIGGLHQGGCNSDTSYGAPFTPAVSALLARAVAPGPGDALPTAGPDGC